MAKYTFSKRVQEPCFPVVDVSCDGVVVACLDLTNRVQRGHNITKLKLLLGEEAATRLIAFGESQTITYEEDAMQDKLPNVPKNKEHFLRRLAKTFWVAYDDVLTVAIIVLTAFIMFLLVGTLDAHAVPYDKKAHFAAGCLVSTATNEVLRNNQTLSPLQRAGYAVASSMAVGAAKEVWDRGRNGHTSSVADINATALGGVVCASMNFTF